MKAIMLAAGLGSRLYGNDDVHPHKALLKFGGKSLIQRHVETLLALGVEGLTLVVGYRAEAIIGEIEAIGAGGFVRFIHNPDFRRGSNLSLWCAREVLAGESDVLFMDADVLYHPDLIARLIRSPHPTCFLLDRDFEAGDEPVKLCMRDGHPVEFRKVVGDIRCDFMGEWPGFLKVTPRSGGLVVAALQRMVDEGRLDEPYEEAVREVLLSAPPGTFGVEDITGIPWIEIDFRTDVERAERDVLPRIETR
ncbi:MAG: phosphocholine cytidylyltransferase family protein [Alphaproteobacteria bacterium]|nr:phosphocholine cytidylyltransferase family protein [Alphaproteobacteria bacterium]MBF0128676.1 phosphocholine cytidylyltransferase family protein [Alphaproteobacteria bacterium]